MFKKLVSVVAVLFALSVFTPMMAMAGTSVTFAWDASASSDVAGYRLYQRSPTTAYTYGTGKAAVQVPASQLTATLENLPDGQWFWVATAIDAKGNESGPSNEVTTTLDSTAPDAPGNIRITVEVNVNVNK